MEEPGADLAWRQGGLKPPYPQKLHGKYRQEGGRRRGKKGGRKKKGGAGGRRREMSPPQRANPGSATVPFRGVVLRKFVLQALRPFGKQSYSTKFALQLCV